MSHRDHRRCPSPFKDSFETPADARAALNAQVARLAGYTGSRPYRFYECECGYFHLTGTSPRGQSGDHGTGRRRRYADSNHRNKKHSHRRKWSRFRARQL